LIRSDSTVRWIRMEYTTDREAAPTARVMGTLQDISDRKRAEDELSRFFTMSRDLFGFATLDGRFVRVNPSFQRVLGYSETEMCSISFFDLVHPEDLASTHKALDDLGRGIPAEGFKNRYRCKDGSYRWLSWVSVPADDRYVYAVARDISEQKLFEERLALSER